MENIAANYVSSGNQEDMVQALRKLTTPNATTEESVPPAKKPKRQSSSKADLPTDSAMIASSTATNRQTKPKRSGTDQPEKCKHCGKYVIHTDGICDVYNVPAVHMTSTGLSDTQSYSVIFQDTSFDEHEYMFIGVRMAEWLRPGLWEMLMLSRGIEPGQVLTSKKSI